jgi:hypothetical protein
LFSQVVEFSTVGRGDGSNKGCVFHLCLFCLDLLGYQVAWVKQVSQLSQRCQAHSVFQDASEGGTPHSSTRLFIVATLQDGPHPSWLLDMRNALSPAFVANQEKLFEKVRALL